MKHGDRVDVYWENIATEFDVEIMNTPNELGAEYCVKRQDGTIVMVQHYSKMVLRKQEFQP